MATRNPLEIAHLLLLYPVAYQQWPMRHFHAYRPAEQAIDWDADFHVGGAEIRMLVSMGLLLLQPSQEYFRSFTLSSSQSSQTLLRKLLPRT